MKMFLPIVVFLVGLLALYWASSRILGGYPVGFSKGRLIIYKYTCADLCPQQGYWYKSYYGNISYEECVFIGGKPALVGLIVPDSTGKPGPGSIGGYDGCKVQ